MTRLGPFRFLGIWEKIELLFLLFLKPDVEIMHVFSGNFHYLWPGLYYLSLSLYSDIWITTS